MTSDICLIPHVDGQEVDKTLAILTTVARIHRARLQNKKRTHPVTDCRSPIYGGNYSHLSSASEASHDTAIFIGENQKYGRKADRGYKSDMDYAVQITPIGKKMSFDLHGRSESLADLPLPTKSSKKSAEKMDRSPVGYQKSPPALPPRVPMVPKPGKIFLSDQELSGIDSGHEDIIVKCKPKIQPKTYARTRMLPLMSETEDESSRQKRQEPVSTVPVSMMNPDYSATSSNEIIRLHFGSKITGS